MTDNVVKFPGETFAHVPVEKVIKGALEADLADVLILGWDKDGGLYASSSLDQTRSNGRPEGAIFLMEYFKAFLLNDDTDED